MGHGRSVAPSPAPRVYVTTLELEAMALEAQQRDTLSRVSFEDWATVLIELL